MFSASSQSSDVDVAEHTLFHQENSNIRFLFGPSHFHVNSSAVHRIHKFLCCAWNHHYEPYKNHKPRKGILNISDDARKGLDEQG